MACCIVLPLFICVIYLCCSYCCILLRLSRIVQLVWFLVLCSQHGLFDGTFIYAVLGLLAVYIYADSLLSFSYTQESLLSTVESHCI